MRRLLLISIAILYTLAGCAQNIKIDKIAIQEDLNDLIQNISNLYVYLGEKQVDIECIKEKYTSRIDDITTQGDVILFFEYLLNEFYDNHISLNTNIRESYRLSSPIYVEIEGNKVIIKNVWQTQLENLEENILKAEVVKFNQVDFNKMIDDFPSMCQNKTLPEVRNWIANKIISGKYSEPRILELKLLNGEIKKIDLDGLVFKKDDGLLSSQVMGDIGIIRINNSLGNNYLITEFDKVLNDLMDTKGLIIDLRNTNNGGNTYVAKGIMGRFIEKDLPYQKHQYVEQYDGQPSINRSWLEIVSPRGALYKKPLVILVGRWTGSMGEGMAIGFDAMNRGKIVGTEMKRLAGSDFDFRFQNQNFGYKLILQKIYHIDGTPREMYIPLNYVSQSTITEDETLVKGIHLLKKMTK